MLKKNDKAFELKRSWPYVKGYILQKQYENGCDSNYFGKICLYESLIFVFKNSEDMTFNMRDEFLVKYTILAMCLSSLRYYSDYGAIIKICCSYLTKRFHNIYKY